MMKKAVALTMSCLLLAASVYADTFAYIPNQSSDSDADYVTRVDTAADPLTYAYYDFTDNESDPYGVAVTPDGNYIWVTLNGFDQVVRLTNSSFTESGIEPVNLPENSKPRGVAIDTDGTYAYVANYGNNNVSKIKVSNYTVVDDPIDVGEGPWGIAVYYDEAADENRIYVTNYDEGTITVITDDDSDITRDTIPGVGSGPLGVGLTPDGRYLYVALYNSNRVAVIRTSDNSVFDSIDDVGDGPWGIAVGNDGAYVYVSNSLENTVSVIDTEDRTVIGEFDVGDTPLGIAAPKYGDFAYVVNQGSSSNSISRVDMGDETVEEIGKDKIEGAYALGAFIGGSRPAAPSALTATETSNDTIELTWEDNAWDELGYKIERRREDEDAYTVIASEPADSTTYIDDGLDKETAYTYRIRAYNEAADSVYSYEATATTEKGSFSWCFIGLLWP